MFVKRILLAIVAWASLTLPLWAQREDQIYLTKGAPARGTIPGEGAMSRDKVTIDTAATPRDIPVNEIVRITFRDEPSELNLARTQVLQKNYNQALIELKKVEGQKMDRAYVRQDAEFYRALCLCRLAFAEGGDRKAASAAMLAFVSKAPQSYHFYEAAEILGDLAMASGQYADAARYYGPSGLGAAPARWTDYQARANNAAGRALIGDKQYDVALEKFKTVINGDSSTPEAVRQINLAQVGRAICLAETSKVDEAFTILQDVISKTEQQDPVLFGRLYNALGRCYLKQNKAKDALMAYLHTDVLYSADAESHAEALYHLSKLWLDINKPDRGTAAKNLLRERYAGTVWAGLE